MFSKVRSSTVSIGTIDTAELRTLDTVHCTVSNALWCCTSAAHQWWHWCNTVGVTPVPPLVCNTSVAPREYLVLHLRCSTPHALCTLGVSYLYDTLSVLWCSTSAAHQWWHWCNTYGVTLAPPLVCNTSVAPESARCYTFGIAHHYRCVHCRVSYLYDTLQCSMSLTIG